MSKNRFFSWETYWLAEGWSLILAEPGRTRPAGHPRRQHNSELIWADIWAETCLSFCWSDQNSDHGCIKDHQTYQNQDQDSKPQSWTSSILQSPKWGHRGHGCSLHPKNHDREPKYQSWLYQRPMTISKSKSRYRTPVKNAQCPPKPQMRT